jgi:hypothetical protein
VATGVTGQGAEALQNVGDEQVRAEVGGSGERVVGVTLGTRRLTFRDRHPSACRQHHDTMRTLGRRDGIVGPAARHLQTPARQCSLRERHHKTVALTLLHRPHPAIRGEQIQQCLIQSRKGRRHLLGLGLPQPRGALHIGQKQRHRARRQKPVHAKIAPVHQRRVHAWINLAHASQHAAHRWRKHQRKRVKADVARRISFLLGRQADSTA